MSKVLVIGAGAAGLMAAGTAAQYGNDVTVLEKNDRPARKVMITGKGRCNVTNNCCLINELIDNVPTNGRFLFSSFSRFMPSDTMDFFENNGVPLKIERGNRVFPESDKAVDIVDALVRFAKRNNVKFQKGRAVDVLVKDGSIESILSEDGKKIPCEKVIIATGGKSYPLTGSTGDGYDMAKRLGHTITPIKPSLVPLELKKGNWNLLQGLSLKNVAVKIIDSDTYLNVYEDFGEMLFTHFGVSGPVILSASSHLRDIKPNKYILSIDLKPALSEEKLDARILRELKENNNKSISTIMASLVPKSLIPVILENAEINPSATSGYFTKEMRSSLVYSLKNLEYTIKSTRPIEEAIITSGGISVKEIDPKTMQSKICSGLYFAGEVIDVDAYTGGFNLQIAFSTGYVAGCNV